MSVKPIPPEYHGARQLTDEDVQAIRLELLVISKRCDRLEDLLGETDPTTRDIRDAAERLDDVILAAGRRSPTA